MKQIPKEEPKLVSESTHRNALYSKWAPQRKMSFPVKTCDYFRVLQQHGSALRSAPGVWVCIYRFVYDLSPLSCVPVVTLIYVMNEKSSNQLDWSFIKGTGLIKTVTFQRFNGSGDKKTRFKWKSNLIKMKYMLHIFLKQRAFTCCQSCQSRRRRVLLKWTKIINCFTLTEQINNRC